MSNIRDNQKEFSFEVVYPQIFSLIITIILFFILDYDLLYKEYDNLLNGTITFASIVIGFLGALLGILLSIKDAEIVQEVFSDTKKEYLVMYFKHSLITGTIFIILSCILYYGEHMTDTLIIKSISLDQILILSWFFIFTFFILSSYRIISIMMRIVFKSPQSGKKPHMESVEQDIEERLKEKYKDKTAKD